jgi:hypothetical protein
VNVWEGNEKVRLSQIRSLSDNSHLVSGPQRTAEPNMTESSTVDVFVKHTLGELYSANLKHLLRRLRWALLSGGLLTALLGAVLIYAITHDSPDHDAAMLIQGTRPWFLFMITISALIMIVPLVAARRSLRDPRAKDGFNYHISRDGVRVEGSSGKSELNWTAFVDVREVSKAFFLFVHSNFFHVIPKRSLARLEDLALLREILREKFPKATILRDS